MRDIKFRLINNGKIVGYEKHELDTACGTINIYHNDMNIEAVEDAYIPHDNKEQYTGLHDKNGVKIYEGDVIKFHNKVLWVVTWNRSRLSFMAQCNVHGFGEPRVFDELEVTGDIHTNPELLEVNQTPNKQ